MSNRKEQVEITSKELSIQKQCELLSLHRSSYYYEPIPASKEDLTLMREIDELYMEFSSYGSRQLTTHLRRKGYIINRKRVVRLMKLMGIQAIYPKPKRKGVDREVIKYPYLLKDLDIKNQNHVWGADITYIPMNGGFLYLVGILDLHSRYVLSWKLSNNMEVDFCISSLNTALKHGKPLIMNTDQGTQFTSRDWVNQLIDNEIKISMSGKGRCFDNIFVERFWRTLKYEEVYQKQYDSPAEAAEEIGAFIEKYNKRRVHSSLKGKTPWETYLGDPPPDPLGQNQRPNAPFET